MAKPRSQVAIAQALGIPYSALPNVNPFSNVAINPKSHVRIFAGIDSLTDGAGGSSYRDYFVPAMKAAYGDAGEGYCHLSYGGMVDKGWGSNFGKTAGVGYIDGLAWNASPRTLSLSGAGLYTAAAAANESFNFGPTSTSYAEYPWDCVVMYCELLSSSASFKFRQIDENSSTTFELVDSATKGYPINKLIKIVRPCTSTSLKANFTAYNITDACAFYGFEIIKAGGPQPGVTFTNCGIGGTALSSWAGLNDTRQREWARMLRPDIWIMNAGMNDRGSSSAAIFARDLELVLDRFQSQPSTQIILVKSNDPQDYNTTNIMTYASAMKAAAHQRKLAYIDDRDIPQLVNYATASAGYMVDGIHPNAAGNILRSAYYFSKIMP